MVTGQAAFAFEDLSGAESDVDEGGTRPEGHGPDAEAAANVSSMKKNALDNTSLRKFPYPRICSTETW